MCDRSTGHNLPLAAAQGPRRTRRLRLAARKLRRLVAVSAWQARQALQLPPGRPGGARGTPLIVAAVNATTAVHCCKECESSGHAHCLWAACHQHTCLQSKSSKGQTRTAVVSTGPFLLGAQSAAWSGFEAKPQHCFNSRLPLQVVHLRQPCTMGRRSALAPGRGCAAPQARSWAGRSGTCPPVIPCRAAEHRPPAARHCIHALRLAP